MPVLLALILALLPCGPLHAAGDAVLSAAVIRGGKVYTPLQLLPAYQNALGQPITPDTAQSIMSAIAAQYLRDGYARPELQLDASHAHYGILGFDVFEARITHVSIHGNAGPYLGQLQSLGTEVTALEPLRPRTLQDIVRRMRAMPGLNVEVTTRRDATAPNGYVMLVDTRFEALETKLRLTNRGTRDVGPNFLIGQLVANGVFGRDVNLGLLFGSTATSREFHGAGLFIDLPVVDRDTRLTVSAFRSHSNPSEHPLNLDIQYRHDRAAMGLRRRWANGNASDLVTVGSFELDDLLSRYNGTSLQTNRLRIFDLTTQLSWTGENSTQYLGQASARKGIDGLGAELRDTTLDAAQRHSEFASLRLQFVRVARLGQLWQWRIDALGQYSGDVLADRERFKIGGDRLGRGFDVPALAGDQGVGGKLELRRDLPSLRNHMGAVSLYGSYDLGVTRTNDLRDSQSAATAAIGAYLQGKHVGGYLELAKPLTHPDVDGRRDFTVVFDVSMQFSPMFGR